MGSVGRMRVGITDAVRFVEATSNGPNHGKKWAASTTEAGIRQLLSMSTYHQVREGVAYPAVLFTAGMNDTRVAPWLAFKTFCSHVGCSVQWLADSAAGGDPGRAWPFRNH